MKLRGKTIFITGASAGIGRSVAELLATADTKLVITARRLVELEQVADEVRSLGSRCLVVAADALDEKRRHRKPSGAPSPSSARSTPLC